MKVFPFFLIFLFFFSSSLGQTNKQIRVAFRLDFIYDYHLTTVLQRLVQVFQSKNYPLTLGINAGRFGEDVNLFDLLNGIVNTGIWEVEFASNGWTTENYSDPSLTWYNKQILMQNSKSQIETLLNLQPIITFIPPFDEINNQTVEVAQSVGFTRFSANTQTDTESISPYGVAASNYVPGILRFPASTSTSPTNLYNPVNSSNCYFQLQKQINGGFGVVEMNLEDFAINGNQDIPDENRITLLEWLLDEVILNNTPSPLGNLNRNNPSPPVLTGMMEFPHSNCNCIAFRLDEVQDSYLMNVQNAIINVFYEMNVSLTIGIISSQFGTSNNTVSLIQEGIENENLCLEIALTGLDQIPLTSSTFDTQKSNLNQAIDGVGSVLDISPTTLLPYNGEFNSDTLTAMQQLGLTHLSSYYTIDLPPFPENNPSVWHFPQGSSTNNLANVVRYEPVSADNAWIRVLAQLERDGFSVIMLHAQDFSQQVYSGGYYQYTDNVNETMINELKQLISLIQQAGLRITVVGQINEYFNNGTFPQPCIHSPYVPSSSQTGLSSVALTAIIIIVIGCVCIALILGIAIRVAKNKREVETNGPRQMVTTEGIQKKKQEEIAQEKKKSKGNSYELQNRYNERLEKMAPLFDQIADEIDDIEDEPSEFEEKSPKKE